jgi:hypothetical protein
MSPRRSKSTRTKTVDNDDWIAGEGGYEDIPETEFDPWRFWLGPGEEKEIVFLDGDGVFSDREPFPYYQHQMKIDGNWGNFETCLSGKKAGKNLCFLCSPRMRKVKTLSRSFVGACTIIVTTPYKIKKGRRKGEKVKNTKMLLCLKPGAMKVVKRLVDKHKVITGARVTAYRPDSESPNTGSVFEIEEHIVDPDTVLSLARKNPDDGFEKVMDQIAEALDIDDPKGTIVAPYEYKDVLRPKVYDEQQELYAYLARQGDDEEDGPSYD